VAAGAEAELIQSRALIAKALQNLDFQITATPDFLSLLRHAAVPCAPRLWPLDLRGFRDCIWRSADLSVVRFDVPQGDLNNDFQLVAITNGRFRLNDGRIGLSAEGVAGHPLVTQSASGPVTLLVASIRAADGTSFTLKRRSALAVLEEVRQNLVVTELRNNSGVLNVTLRGKDPAMISALLSEMARLYMAGMATRSTQEIDKTRAYIQEQLIDARRRLQESEGRYRQFRNGKAAIDPGEDARSNAQQLATAKAQKLELEQKRTELLVRFTANHPIVNGVDVQIQNINTEIRRLGSYMKALPSLDQENQALARDLKSSTENYESLLTMDRQLGIARASASGNVSMVDMPALPEHPTSDRLGILAVLGGLAGLLTAAAAVLWRKVTKHGISNFVEIEQKTGLPVYVSVPYSHQQEKSESQCRKERRGAPLLARNFAMDPAVEALRHFRATLQFSLPQQKNNIVLLTSATADSGKSFIAANLSVLLGSGSRKVLLIDADLRNGSLQRYFGVGPDSTGLSDVLSGMRGLDGIIHRNVQPNMDFFPSGSVRGDSAELLLQPALEKILGVVASDCLTLGTHAGAIYLVARADVSTGSQLVETVRRLKQVGLSARGFIFNSAGAASGVHGYSQRHRKPSRIKYTLNTGKIELPDKRGVRKAREV
jgi:tyrosine-protein kinase Etk/Wzc